MPLDFGSVAGPIGGVIGNVIGGIFGSNQAQANRDAQWQMADLNYQRAKEFAQNSIQWKVADSKAAGIHPLFGLGAGGSSFSGSAFSNVDDQSSQQFGQAFANMGQGLGRALSANSTKLEKVQTAFELERQRQTLENGNLQNELLRQQINQQAAGGLRVPSNPGYAPRQMIAGQSATDLGPANIKPTEVGTPGTPGSDIASGPPAPTTLTGVDAFGGIERYPDPNMVGEPEAENVLIWRWGLKSLLKDNFSNDVPPHIQRQGEALYGKGTPMFYNPFTQSFMPILDLEDAKFAAKVQAMRDAPGAAVEEVRKSWHQFKNRWLK